MHTFVNKTTNSDKRRIISDKVGSSLAEFDEYHYPWLVDFDDDFIYFEISKDGEYRSYKVSYTMPTEVTVELGDEEPKLVVRTTEYKDIEENSEEVEKSLESKIMRAVKSILGKQTPVIKKFQEEEQISLEYMYVTAGDVDLALDTIDAESVHGMVESCSKAIAEGELEPNLFHKVLAVNKDGQKLFEFTKAYVTTEETQIGDVVVPKDTPLVETKWHCNKAWNMRKSGELGAPSIGCFAEIEEL